MMLPERVSGLAPREKANRSGMRVAFFGGSFDPPHLGHLAVARAARAAFALDAVLFAPVGMQPLKPEGSAASFEDRLAMTRLAIACEPGFEVSLVDAPRPAAGRKSTPNYTIDTLEKLARLSCAGQHTLLPVGRRLVSRPAPLASRRRDPFCGAVDRGLAAGAAARGPDECLANRAFAGAGSGRRRHGNRRCGARLRRGE